MSISKALRIVFMGTPDFAREALQALCEAGHDVICVYSQPPRPKGRGHKMQNSPVHDYALSRGIEVRTPASLKNAEAQNEFTALKADIAIVAAYGLILPKAILEAPRYGCLNIHASLLPRWRGASPIQRAILAGDKISGVTIMQMDEGLDTGPMIVKGEVPITPETTASSLHDALAELGAKLSLDVLERLSREGKLEAEAQDSVQSTYAPLLKKEDGAVDWSASADEIDRQVRALNPWPGVWAELQGKRFKILQVTLSENDGGAPGRILDKSGLIQCGGNTRLRILKLQPEGKNAMDFASALNGGYITL